jgi:hypothetical protein
MVLGRVFTRNQQILVLQLLAMVAEVILKMLLLLILRSSLHEVLSLLGKIPTFVWMGLVVLSGTSFSLCIMEKVLQSGMSLAFHICKGAASLSSLEGY